MLEDVDDVTVESVFKTLLKHSVAFMLLTRCGYDARSFFAEEDFADVTDFDTLVVLSLIHISEPTRLRRISYAVFCLKKKKDE